MKRRCKKCRSELYQAEDLKSFCLLCLAKEIETRDQEDEVSGTWRVLGELGSRLVSCIPGRLRSAFHSVQSPVGMSDLVPAISVSINVRVRLISPST